jgi:hypothetical protein
MRTIDHQPEAAGGKLDVTAALLTRALLELRFAHFYKTADSRSTSWLAVSEAHGAGQCPAEVMLVRYPMAEIS